MHTREQLLDAKLLEMRWRILSLAADLDRLQRWDRGAGTAESDPRLVTLRAALLRVAEEAPGRAEAVQLLFSDLTPGPLEAENP